MEFVPDQGVNVEFYRDSVESQYQSLQAGHPVYVEKPFIRIAIPGSQNTIIETRADETHQKRFPDLWRRFQQGQSGEGITGWKLEEWPQVNTAQVKTLKYMNVHTVEMLAGLSDTAAQSVGMGVTELRAKAKAALAAAAGTAGIEAQAVTTKRLEDEIAALRAQLSASVEPARGPGRPRKAE